MSELKPCPFCGRTLIVDDCGDNRYFVKCKCGIVQDKLYAQKCDAVRRWNTRKTGKIAKDTNVPSNDCISRQAAIEAVEAVRDCIRVEGYWAITERIGNLPSAQPTHTTHSNTLDALDCISRQVVTDLVHLTILEFMDYCADSEEEPMTEKNKLLLEVNKKICTRIKELPSAQPEHLCVVMDKISKAYEKAINTPCIHNPMAWALYQVWKEYDR